MAVDLVDGRPTNAPAAEEESVPDSWIATMTLTLTSAGVTGNA